MAGTSPLYNASPFNMATYNDVSVLLPTLTVAPLDGRATLLAPVVVVAPVVAVAPLVGAGALGPVVVTIGGTATQYHVYGNAGQGDPINYAVALATVDGLTWTSAPLAHPGTWRFGVRAFDAVSGLEE